MYIIITPEKDYHVDSDILPRKGDILDVGDIKTFKVISVRINLRTTGYTGAMYKFYGAVVEVELWLDFISKVATQKHFL